MLYVYFRIVLHKILFKILYKIQTQGNYPEESIHHSEHGESLKSGKFTYNLFNITARISGNMA
jgi:hypothetical protein